MVIWITGPSGAGKTTIGRALYDHLKPQRRGMFLMDGDEFRKAMGNDLGYSIEERRENGLRIIRLMQLLESQDITVVCCASTIHPDVQDFGHANLRSYYQVYIDVSLDTLRRRDIKDIYRRALEGEMVDVVGVDIDLVVPKTPHLVINNDKDRKSFDDLIDEIMGYVGTNNTASDKRSQQLSQSQEGFSV